ncbi:PhoU domain-containing protein [Halolamina salifodinae]|uniref:Phosphate uptake regulator n=1 Tax=Halolamina salifodinae TaxID=1202767 RepID=A0A8T4H1C0_9EURY|nr:phosphate uptake regulator PhoU [Halolamina salifodinae]MBP1987385.1 phosphate uptake regulator [Halolamina salifodinae]
METRKVQQVGGGTYTVSIPVGWAEEHGLEAGGTAYLYTHRDGSLVVRWAERDENALAATEIDLANADGTATRHLLMAAYTAGFDRITLHRREELTDGQLRAVENVVRGLTGVEIAEETGDRIVVRGMLDADGVSVRQSLLQLQFTALSMHEEAIAAFVGERADPAQVAERDDEADRVFRLVERHLNRSLVRLSEVDDLRMGRPRLFDYYCTARNLERVADHAARIAGTAARETYTVPESVAGEFRAMSDAARDVVRDASDAVVNGAPRKAAQDALDRSEAVVAEGRRLESRIVEISPAHAAVLTRLLDSLVRTAKCGGNIADLALRRSVRA